MPTEVQIGTMNLATIEPLPLERNPAAVYLAALASGSRRTMHQALQVVGSLLMGGKADPLAVPWQSLRYQHVAAIRSQLAERYAPSTANKILCALRGALREGWRLGLIGEADYRKAIDVKGVPGETLPAGRALSSGEIAGLIDACADDPSAAGARDAAVIAVLYACGLRRSEVRGLDLADVDLTAGSLTVRRGKGRKDRSVPIASGCINALRDWIAVRGSLPGPLFSPIDKGGKVSLECVSSQAVYNLLQKRAAQAAVTNLSPHDFRRSMISHLLDAGADLVVVSKLAGHASVTTTSRYDRRGEEAKRKAVELLHVPYHPRTGPSGSQPSRRGCHG